MMTRINRFTLKAAEDARIEALHGDSLNTPCGTLAFASGLNVQRDTTSGSFRLRNPHGDINIAVLEGNLADCFHAVGHGAPRRRRQPGQVDGDGMASSCAGGSSSASEKSSARGIAVDPSQARHSMRKPLFS